MVAALSMALFALFILGWVINGADGQNMTFSKGMSTFPQGYASSAWMIAREMLVNLFHV